MYELKCKMLNSVFVFECEGKVCEVLSECNKMSELLCMCLCGCMLGQGEGVCIVCV